jgi:hypothetical protein
LLEGIENSSIWRTLQEDQDCSVPTSFDLETRTGQRNAIPKAPSDPQKIPQVSARYPTVYLQSSCQTIVRQVEGQGSLQCTLPLRFM